MSEDADYNEELLRIRSLLIATSLERKQDRRALRLIQKFSQELKWDLAELRIDTEAWAYVIDQGYDAKLVFCHPQVLLEFPVTSLYYRGLSGLSIKATKGYVGAVESLEAGNPGARLTEQKALLMAQTYNTFISSVIKGSEHWKLSSGHRMIVANMGITLDGSMRNRIGTLAEGKIRTLILEWLDDNGLILQPENLKGVLAAGKTPAACELQGNITMRFGSEPDISFLKQENYLATVEIKGGTDAAGALERYGAATKSFQHAISVSPKCMNFYLGAVFTDELVKRMDGDRLVHKRFSVVTLLESPEYRADFFNELFHHALRII